MQNSPTTYKWLLQPHVDKVIVFPNESINFNLQIYNLQSNYLYFGDLIVHIPWFGEWETKTSVTVEPVKDKFLTSFRIPMPGNVLGEIKIGFTLATWDWNSALSKWQFSGNIKTEQDFSLWAMPLPRYRAFVSRSNRGEDRPVVEPIVNLIQWWGFETYTLGIDEFIKDPNKIPQKIKEEIIKSDCLFAIVTPRDISALDGFYKTLTWLHNEVGMAYIVDKPILLIVQDSVNPEGLIATQSIPHVVFSPLDLASFSYIFNGVMPIFRDWIKEHKQKEFDSQLKKLIEEVATGAFIAGYALGGGKAIK